MQRFRLSNGDLLGPFTARRSMRGGDSWAVEVDRFEDLYPLMLKVGKKLPAGAAQCPDGANR